jgi:cyclopropane fatty-acyl-phospholipid synthase-like methyltransferase
MIKRRQLDPPDLVRVERCGSIHGPRVLDIGCSSGENAIFLARKGYAVTAIDYSPSAIVEARRRVKKANVTTDFSVADALSLSCTQPQYDTIIDFGLYHSFHNEDTARYISSLKSLVRTGGRVILQCFSENAPKEPLGPRLVEKTEVETVFSISGGREVQRIEPAHFQTRKGSTPAWLATINRRERRFTAFDRSRNAPYFQVGCTKPKPLS